MGTHDREREKCALHRPPAGGASDPVFAAITAHTRCWREMASDGYEAAGQSEVALLDKLLATVPTTRAGLIAWLDHLETGMGFAGGHPSEAEFSAILRTVRAFTEAGHE